MATVTTTVTINSTTYTALSATSTYVETFVPRGVSVRFHVAAAAPSDSTAAYELIHGPSEPGEQGTRVVWSGLASDEEVYCRLDNVTYRTADFAATTVDLVVITSNTLGAGGSGSVAGAVTVSGLVAADSPSTANPVPVGALARTSTPTAVTSGDVVNVAADVYGRLIALGALRENKGIQTTTITSSAVETTIVTADATYKLDIYRLTIANTSATAAIVTIKDSTSGTTRFTFAVPAGQTVGFSAKVDSGAIQNAANNNWTATCTSVASIFISAEYVKSL